MDDDYDDDDDNDDNDDACWSSKVEVQLNINACLSVNV